MEISNSQTESNKLSTAHQPGQAVAFIEMSSEEAEAMDLKKRSSLRGLMVIRGKGATSPEASKVQTPVNLPPPPPLPLIDQGLHPNLDPKKKRPIQELEEGEMLPQKGAKQQKAKDQRDKRSKSMESRDDVEVHRLQCACSHDRDGWGPYPLGFHNKRVQPRTFHVLGSSLGAAFPSPKGHGSA